MRIVYINEVMKKFNIEKNDLLSIRTANNVQVPIIWIPRLASCQVELEQSFIFNYQKAYDDMDINTFSILQKINESENIHDIYNLLVYNSDTISCDLKVKYIIILGIISNAIFIMDDNCQTLSVICPHHYPYCVFIKCFDICLYDNEVSSYIKKFNIIDDLQFKPTEKTVELKITIFNDRFNKINLYYNMDKDKYYNLMKTGGVNLVIDNLVDIYALTGDKKSDIWIDNELNSKISNVEILSSNNHSTPIINDNSIQNANINELKKECPECSLGYSDLRGNLTASMDKELYNAINKSYSTLTFQLIEPLEHYKLYCMSINRITDALEYTNFINNCKSAFQDYVDKWDTLTKFQWSIRYCGISKRMSSNLDDKALHELNRLYRYYKKEMKS